MTAASDAASDVASEDALQFATPRKGFTAESDTSMREAIYSDVADAGFSEGAADMASSADEYHTSRGFNTRHPLRCVSREFPRVQQTTGVPKSQSASPSTTTPGVLSPEFRYTKFTRERSVANLTAMFEPKKASGGEDASTEPASPSPTRPSVKDTEFSGPKLNVAEEANDVIFGEAGDTRANLAQISRPTRFVKRLSGTLNEKLNEHLNTTFGRVDLADQKLAITPNNRGSASDDAPLSSQFLSSLSPVDENKIKGVKSDPPLRCSTDKMDFTPRREGDVLDPEKYGSSRRDFYGDDIAASLTLKPLPKLPCDATTVAQNNNNNASNGHRKVSFKPSSFEASIIDSDMDVTDDEDKRKRHFEVAMHRLTEKSSDEPVDEETMTDWINSRYFRKSIDNAGITVAVGSDEEDINEQNNASAQHGGSHTTHGVDEVVEMQQKPHNLNHKQPTVEDDIQSTDQAQVGASHSPQPATAPSTLETVQRSPSFRPNSPISARYKTTATSHANLHRTSSNTHRVMAPAMSFGSLHSTAAASASTTANVNNRPDLRDLPYTTQSGIPQRANSRSTGYRQPTVSSTQRSSTQRTVSRLSTAPAATNAGPSRTASVDSASNARTASQIPRRDHTSQGSNRSTLVNDDNDLLAGFAAQGVNEARFAHVEHLTNRLAEVFGDLNNRVSVNENEVSFETCSPCGIIFSCSLNSFSSSPATNPALLRP